MAVMGVMAGPQHEAIYISKQNSYNRLKTGNLQLDPEFQVSFTCSEAHNSNNSTYVATDDEHQLSRCENETPEAYVTEV